MSLRAWLTGELRACVGASAQGSEILASCVEVCMEGDGTSSTEERLQTVADLVEGETGTRPSRAFLEELGQRWQHGNAAAPAHEKNSADTTGLPSCPHPSKEGTHPLPPHSSGSRCAYVSRDTIVAHSDQCDCGGDRADDTTSSCGRGINSRDCRLVVGAGDKDDTPSTLEGRRSTPEVTPSRGVGAGTYRTKFDGHGKEIQQAGEKELGTTEEGGTRSRSGRPGDHDDAIVVMMPGRGQTHAHPGSTAQPAAREAQGRNTRRKGVGGKDRKGKEGLGGAWESKGELQPQTRAPPASVYASNEKPGAICISVLAKPNAKQSKIVAVADEAVDIQIGAPPRDGAANTELAGFLAEVCGVRRNRVSVAAGSRSRCKLVTVEGAGSATDVATKLEAALELL